MIGSSYYAGHIGSESSTFLLFLVEKPDYPIFQFGGIIYPGQPVQKITLYPFPEKEI